MSALQFGDYVVQRDSRRLFHQGELVPIPAKAFDLLCFFADNAGRPLGKEELLAALWPNAFVEESNLSQTVFLLRRALGLAGEGLVVTLPRRGYQFTGVVRKLMPEDIGPSAPAVTLAASADVSFAKDQSWLAPAETPTSYTFEEEVVKEVRGRHVVSSRAVLAVVATFAVIGIVLFLDARRPKRLRIVSAVRLTNDGVPKNLGPYHSPLVSDGTLLHFIEREDNVSLLASVPVGGGEVRRSPAPFPDAVLGTYSPLNRTLLLSSNSHLEDRPILGASPPNGPFRQIGSLTGHEASWSPDGKLIAYAEGRFLFLADPTGDNRRRIASVDGLVLWPRWSPRGDVLRFTENPGDGHGYLWEIAADGSRLHRLLEHTPEGKQAGYGDWSADGRNFFFTVYSTNHTSIWVLPEASKMPFSRTPTPLQLTSGSDDVWQGPLTTPDSSAIWSIGAHLRGELVRINPTSHAPEPYLHGLSAEGVAFSPDRTWIAYTAYPSGTLWRSHPDGSEKRPLTQEPMIVRFPQWSPDGRTIAFMGTLPNAPIRIYLIGGDGSGLRPMLEESASQGVPNWSPGGDKISYGGTNGFANDKDPNLAIQIYDLHTRSRTTVSGSAGLWTARWSPDGRYISAVTGDNRTLRLFDTRSRIWTDLASVGVNDVIWSRDSRFLFFDTDLGGDPIVYRISIDTRKLEPWANLKGFHRGGFDGPWLGISPDGDPLVTRDTSIEEVYRLNLSSSNP
jgi:Tol biopolymer transport system component/DNA-binding winged helix-turn-helix (wHTH) protein